MPRAVLMDLGECIGRERGREIERKRTGERERMREAGTSKRKHGCFFFELSLSMEKAAAADEDLVDALDSRWG